MYVGVYCDPCTVHCIPFTMDLIHIDVIIDKMVVLLWGLRHVLFLVTKTSLVYGFRNMGTLDNEGKRLVSMMWRCEIIPPGETRPKF